MRLFALLAVVGLSLAACNETPLSYPSDQLEFLKGRDDLASKYSKAPNEIQKSAIFRDALAWTNAYAKAHGLAVRNWKGRITKLTTDHGGDTVDLTISAKMPNTTVDVYRWDAGALSTPIKRGSTVYQQLTDLKDGEVVCFSGEFERHSTQGFSEKSMTERGYLDNPEFRFTFTDVRKCS